MRVVLACDVVRDNVWARIAGPAPAVPGVAQGSSSSRPAGSRLIAESPAGRVSLPIVADERGERIERAQSLGLGLGR